MRDVKNLELNCLGKKARYCLNYAGCKETDLTVEIYDGDCIALTMRDVKKNEDCKAFSYVESIALTMRDVKLPNRAYASWYRPCIALTMRDVKACKEKGSFPPMKYCLNYAGCKDDSKSISFAVSKCIALTMRDVKIWKPDGLRFSGGVLP